MDQYKLIHAGTGRNLAEASQPVYLECPSGRVALVAVTSSFYESWMAGDQRKDMTGRPGVNHLRVSTTYHCKPEEFEALKEIARLTGINAYDDMIRKEGFLPELQNDEFMFGQYSFKKSLQAGVETKPFEKDMIRLERTVSQAKSQADYVLVSIHSHQIKGTDKDYPADFLVTASKRCIDAGAHAVIGHGELTKIKLVPIELGYHLPPYKSGWPHISESTDIPERLSQLCKPFSVQIHIQDRVGIIK